MNPSLSWLKVVDAALLYYETDVPESHWTELSSNQALLWVSSAGELRFANPNGVFTLNSGSGSGNFATYAQGLLAESALQSGNNISLLSNNMHYATEEELDGKMDKAIGWGLTENNFSNEEKSKVDSMPAVEYLLNRANQTGTQSWDTVTGLATVAYSNNYNDLINKPTLFSGGSVSSGDLSLVAFSNEYSDLNNKPDLTHFVTGGARCFGINGNSTWCVE